MNNSNIIFYVPSDTPEAMMIATRRVAGVPCLVRGIMTLAQTGARSITLLTARTQKEKIEKFIEKYRDRKLPDLKIISYAEPYRVSPEIVKSVGGDIAQTCILINANLLFEKELVESIASQPVTGDTIFISFDGAHPLPVIRLTTATWMELESFTAERPRSIESCLKFLLESHPHISVQKPALTNTFLIQRHRQRAIAEKHLTESIRHSTTGPIAKYINKRVSLPISLILAKLWVSPNAITAVNIIIGLFSGVFVADGHRYDIILFGAALFQIASIIDGCDGEVAKLTFRCSKFGQYIDSISDNLSLASFLIGLIAGYWRHTHQMVAFYAGAILIICTAITFYWMISFLKKNTQSASLVTYDKEYLQKLSGEPAWLRVFIKYGKYLLKKDMFSFLFLLFAIAGALYWVLFIATLGAFVAAAILTYLNVETGIKAWLKIHKNKASQASQASQA